MPSSVLPKKGHRGGDSRHSFVTLDSQAMEQKSQTHRNLRDPSAFDKKESDCGIVVSLIRKCYLKSDATNSKSFVSFNCSSSKVAFIEVSSLAECKALLARLQIEHMREDRQARLICAMINSHLHSPSKILSCCFGFQKQHLCFKLHIICVDRIPCIHNAGKYTHLIMTCKDKSECWFLTHL